MDIFFKNLAERIIDHNSISENMFLKYNVKRGLRNSDGSGVLVGLTEISSVQGYVKEDEEVVPIDGNLLYRGRNLYDLTNGFLSEKRFGFEEIVFLLLTGELPSQKELESFKHLLIELRELPKNFVRDQLSTFKTPNIMNALASSALTMYIFDKDAENGSLENLIKQGLSLIAKFPLIVAYSYRIYLEEVKKQSLIIHKSSNEYDTAENFLHLLRDDSSFSNLEARMLDLALVLHADHGGGNNSTFTTRVVSSSGTDTYSAIAAAIGSLKGPLHGGANKFVMDMMESIKANVNDWTDKDELKTYLKKILNKETENKSGKIYGFGHAVYTISDPRAKILKRQAQKLGEAKDKMNEFNLYNLMEKVVPEVFHEVKNNGKIISPNVDFYSGFVYDMMNIPKTVYTPMFAMARIAGWIAHRIEEVISSKRIIRPAYKNVTTKKLYTPMSKRGL